jgi:hypothetical protein
MRVRRSQPGCQRPRSDARLAAAGAGLHSFVSPSIGSIRPARLPAKVFVGAFEATLHRFYTVPAFTYSDIPTYFTVRGNGCAVSLLAFRATDRRPPIGPVGAPRRREPGEGGAGAFVGTRARSARVIGHGRRPIGRPPTCCRATPETTPSATKTDSGNPVCSSVDAGVSGVCAGERPQKPSKLHQVLWARSAVVTGGSGCILATGIYDCVADAGRQTCG